MKRPTDQQFQTALLWLEANEGNGYEQGACLAVAAWIEAQEKVRIKRYLRYHGCTQEQVESVLKRTP